MTFSKTFALLFAFIIVAISSCTKDPEPVNPEELITNMTLTLTPTDGTADVVFSFSDIDGTGGKEPIISAPALKLNTNYSGEITLLNEAANPVVNVTDEVADEAVDHQFFYSIDTALASQLAVAYDDADANNHPIGIATKFTTKGATKGTLTVTLRHQPDKSGSNVAQGNITNAGGETDIEVAFDVEIK